MIGLLKVWSWEEVNGLKKGEELDKLGETSADQHSKGQGGGWELSSVQLYKKGLEGCGEGAGKGKRNQKKKRSLSIYWGWSNI